MSPGRRRLLAALAAAPLLARGAPASASRVAVMAAGTEAAFRSREQALRHALRGVELDFHYADGRTQRLAEVAQEIVAAAPAAIVSASSLTTRALRAATRTVPIVMASADEPIADRFVGDAAHPNGNVTGLFTGRRDDLVQAGRYLAAMVPAGKTLGGLANQFNVNYRPARARLNFVGQEEKRGIEFLDASTPAEIDRVFDGARARGIGGVLVMDDPMYLDERERLVLAAARARLPVMFADRAFVRAGGLMAYGGDSDADMARVAVFVRKLLGGAKVADLPLEKAAAGRLALNPATARKLGLAFPAALRQAARAT